MIMKILVKTNQKGRVEAFNPDTGDKLTNVNRIDIYITSNYKPYVVITFTDIELNIESEKWQRK